MSEDFVLEPFQPAVCWTPPHVQTILANKLRRTRSIKFQRERIDTPDGDFLDLDFPIIPGFELAESAPLVLVLHGLEGSARRGYTCEMYRQLARLGIRSVGLNFRSCSGEMNRTARLYHSGETQDIDFVLGWLRLRWPDVPLGAVGFSLGSNVLLKYLGERGDGCGLETAVAVSPPFDLAAGSKVLKDGSGRFYGQIFVKELLDKIRQNADVINEKIDVERLLQIKSLDEFDEYGTALLHGFRDAADYYAQCSTAQFLPAIRVPTLLLRSIDDPFFANDIPYATIAANPCLTPGFTVHGGHVGFVEGVKPWAFSYWAERQAARFIAACFSSSCL